MAEWQWVSALVPKDLEPDRQRARALVIGITGIIPVRELTRLTGFYFYLSEINKFNVYMTTEIDGIHFVKGHM
jgi:predicted tellurium resistance membrane protein TerC